MQSFNRWLRIPIEKPIVTIALLAVMVVVYLPALLAPQLYIDFLNFGANQKLSVVNGEWWRLITSTFLHAPNLIWHIVLNGWALYAIGMELEAFVGRARFVAIYAISGLAGSIASFAFMPGFGSSVGASGAIFGLIGALGVYFGLHRRIFGKMGNMQFWNIIVVIVLNLGIGFSGFFPIDNAAHVGGLVAGAVVGFVLCPRYELGSWFNPFVRNLVNSNKGTLTWAAAALIGFIVVFAFVDLLLLFRTGALAIDMGLR